MTLNGNLDMQFVTVSLKNQQTEFKHDSQCHINGRRTLLDHRLAWIIAGTGAISTQYWH